MNGKYTLNLSIQQVAVICRALRLSRSIAEREGKYYTEDKSGIELEYRLTNELLSLIDPGWRLL